MDNNVWAWGENDSGQLGLVGRNRNKPTPIPGLKAKQIACGAYHTVMIDME
jgi:hypothetical protein